MTFRIVFTSLVFFITIFPVTTTMAAGESRFDKAVAEIGESDDIVGLAVAVVRKGELSSLNTFGVREIGRPEPINVDTTFRIASLSKAFAATVAGELVDTDKLSFDDPISSSNKDFQLRDPAQAESVTLTHILSHRISLPPYAYDNLLEAGVTPSKILREMKKVTPVCKVGTCYAYQNVGFNLITSAIESTTQQSYEGVVTESLFAPLGMSGASFGIDGLTRNANWARSHSRPGYRLNPASTWEVKALKQPYYDLPAAGGVNANISDMAKWLAAQMGYAPEVIPPKRLTVLHTPLVATPAELRRNRRLSNLTDAHYGLGWRIYQYAGQTVINHSGSVEGYVAQIAFLPEQDVGIVLLANSRSREFWDILPLFLDSELGLENELLSQTELNH